MIDIVKIDTECQSEGIVTRHQFLMEQAGHARIMRSPTAASKFSFQNSDQIAPVKPGVRPKDVIFTGKID